MQSLSLRKSEARHEARAIRRQLAMHDVAIELFTHFPKGLKQTIVAGFAPIGHEIDIWHLLKQLHCAGRKICLPVTPQTSAPLKFRRWEPKSDMKTDRYGVSFPSEGDALTPQLVLVPLLAFTPRGERLGYGGGYYDRTLEALRETGEVFACGVAYAGQEVAKLPTDAHDARLDGILTETGFKAFI